MDLTGNDCEEKSDDYDNDDNYHNDENDENTCPICLNELDSYFVTKCNHKFHFPCIYTHYAKNNKCPLCKSDLLIELNYFNSSYNNILPYTSSVPYAYGCSSSVSSSSSYELADVNGMNSLNYLEDQLMTRPSDRQNQPGQPGQQNQPDQQGQQQVQPVQQQQQAEPVVENCCSQISQICQIFNLLFSCESCHRYLHLELFQDIFYEYYEYFEYFDCLHFFAMTVMSLWTLSSLLYPVTIIFTIWFLSTYNCQTVIFTYFVSHIILQIITIFTNFRFSQLFHNDGRLPFSYNNINNKCMTIVIYYTFLSSILYLGILSVSFYIINEDMLDFEMLKITFGLNISSNIVRLIVLAYKQIYRILADENNGFIFSI